MKRSNLRKQRGSVLFIMLMILVALTVITLAATHMGRTDLRISNAYSEQSKSFIKGEEMLARLRYALEQVPLPEGIAISGNADKANRPIWLTPNLAKDANPATTVKIGEPDFTDPTFASNSNDPLQGWSEQKTLTCQEIAAWMQSKAGLAGATADGAFQPLDCERIDPKGKTRTVIELVSRKQNEGDIDELRDTYYYRITINAEGDSSGRSLIQGVTGIQYN